MKRKKVFLTELAYAVGLVTLTLGTALMERADFGMSMVVAPAYVIHLKVSAYFPWFSFGVSEFVLQGVLLAVLSLLMGRFKKGYLFSFFTALLYGLILDLFISAVAWIPAGGIAIRLIEYAAGLVLCAMGVAMLFRSYIPAEAYELFVKEAAAKWGKDIGRVKTVYDCCSCLAAIALSFLFFGAGHFEGVKLGTVFCALVNGWLVGRSDRWLASAFCFRDGLKLRRFFES